MENKKIKERKTTNTRNYPKGGKATRSGLVVRYLVNT